MWNRIDGMATTVGSWFGSGCGSIELRFHDEIESIIMLIHVDRDVTVRVASTLKVNS